MSDGFELGHSDDRCEILAKHIILSGDTVRATAALYGFSKSTVHKDVSKRLKAVNPSLHASVSEILAKNKAERHLRGGDATKQMYLNRKSNQK